MSQNDGPQNFLESSAIPSTTTPTAGGRMEIASMPRSRSRSTTNYNNNNNGTEVTKPNDTDPGKRDETLDSRTVPDSRLPSVPDGGYGWVIVFASFMCNFIVDGIANSFGVFLPHYVKSFGVSTGSAAWAGSILCGGYLCMGPIVSALTNKFGCRIVCISGAFVAATGFGLSYFANSLPLLILTYGVIGGMGFGMIYLPSIVCVGYYFERKRSMATGIAVCGSGVGMFVFVPIAGLLLRMMPWEKVHLIFGGVILLCIGCGLLMRPLVVQVTLEQEIEDDEANKELQPEMNEPGHFMVHLPDGTMERRQKQLPTISVDGDPITSADDNDHNLNSVSKNIANKGSVHIRAGNSSASQFSYLGRTYSYKAVPLGVFGKIPHSSSTVSSSGGRKSQLSLLGTSKTKLNSTTEQHQNQDPSSNVGQSKNGEGMLGAEIEDKPEKPVIVQPLARKDVFYTGSVQKLPEYQKRGSFSVDRHNIDEGHHVPEVKVTTPTPPDAKCPRGQGVASVPEDSGQHQSQDQVSFRTALVHMMDFSLLSNPIFIFIAVSNVFAMLGYYIPSDYIVNAAMANEISNEDATLLVSIIGATNTIGRVVTGILSDLPKVNSILMYNVCVGVAGVAVASIPFCSSYYALIWASVVFGLFVAGFIALISIVLVELLGLDKLTSAFGLLILFRGGAAILGPPLAGALFDAFGSYDIPFWTAGGFLITASGISFVIPWVKVKRGN